MCFNDSIQQKGVFGLVKWVSRVLSIALVSSLVVFPQFSHAEKKTQVDTQLIQAKKQEVRQFLQSRKDKVASAAKRQAVSDAEDSAEVVYKGTIGWQEIHNYNLVVKTGGKVNIQSSLPEYQYDLYHLQSGKIYENGDTIPSGEYSFTVIGFYEVPEKYEIKINGVAFEGNPDTSLPNVEVTSPDGKSVRLPKGQKNVQVQGAVSGAEQVGMWSRWGIKSLGSTFKENLALFYGRNFFTIFARNASFNTVWEEYEVTAPGLERIAGADRYETSVNISKQDTSRV